MPDSARGRVVRQLLPLGLARALTVAPGDDACTVGRIRSNAAGQLRLDPLGRFTPVALPVIGRVGPPDPELGAAPADGLLFYGKWFDDIGESDTGFHLRRTIAAAPRERLLEQVRRDDQYALVAEFGAVFSTILDLKQRLPLVLLDDRYLSLASFAVVLPAIDDAALVARLGGILGVMLKAVSKGEDLAATTLSGIEVDESD